jgi:hypothetical protein
VEKLGFRVIFENARVFTLVQRGGVKIGLQRVSDDRVGTGSCYIWVGDIRGLYDELSGKGLTFKDDIATHDEYKLTDFVINDPDGNHIGIGGDEAHEIPDPIHSLPIGYVGIGVRDVAEAKEFYGGLFGWTFRDYGDAYSSFNHGAGDGGFVLTESAASGSVLLALYTDDLEGMLDRIKKNGVEISREPFAFPGGRRFQFLDPSGNELAVWSNA